jgi:hypothetical protein
MRLPRYRHLLPFHVSPVLSRKREANKLTGVSMEKRSYYRNPLTRLETNQPAKSFRIFTTPASAAQWLKVKSNRDRVCLDARGKMRVRRWEDGRVGITYYGAVRSDYRINLAPVRHLTPALWELEKRREA